MNHYIGLFRIKNGDRELAINWLLDISEEISKGNPVKEEDREVLFFTLIDIVKRGEASRFWNNGKEPHKRLNIKKEIEIWIDVKIQLVKDKTLTVAEAQELVADSLSDPSKQQSDEDFDAALDQVKDACRRANRKIKVHKHEQAEKQKMLSEFKDSPFDNNTLTK